MKGLYIRVKINEVSIMFAGSWIKRQFFFPQSSIWITIQSLYNLEGAGKDNLLNSLQLL